MVPTLEQIVAHMNFSSLMSQIRNKTQVEHQPLFRLSGLLKIANLDGVWREYSLQGVMELTLMELICHKIRV
jgi:hypothetical protein